MTYLGRHTLAEVGPNVRRACWLSAAVLAVCLSLVCALAPHQALAQDAELLPGDVIGEVKTEVRIFFPADPPGDDNVENPASDNSGGGADESPGAGKGVAGGGEGADGVDDINNTTRAGTPKSAAGTPTVSPKTGGAEGSKDLEVVSEEGEASDVLWAATPLRSSGALFALIGVAALLLAAGLAGQALRMRID